MVWVEENWLPIPIIAIGSDSEPEFANSGGVDVPETSLLEIVSFWRYGAMMTKEGRMDGTAQNKHIKNTYKSNSILNMCL